MYTPPKAGISYPRFTLLMAGYFALILNLPFYKELTAIFGSLEAVDPGFVVSIPLLLGALFILAFNLFSWPVICKPVFIVLIIVSSSVSYAGFNYGTVFDKEMLINIIETDTSEATAYLSLYSVGWITLLGLLPAWLIYRLKFLPVEQALKWVGWKLLHMTSALLAMLLILTLYYQDYASMVRNHSALKKILIPSGYLSSSVDYLKSTYYATLPPYQIIGADAQQTGTALERQNHKPDLTVLVLGETARAQNYPYNGYPRPTTPFTDSLGMIDFSDVASCGTATTVSVPCLFSNLTHANYDYSLANNRDNVLDILKRAGIDILWRDNDGGDKGVARHVAKQVIDRRRQDAMCNGQTCYDLALLENLDSEVERMKGNRLVVLHLMGSHGPTYYQRYPQELARFQPDCSRADIENCDTAAIVNSYDNTLLYTDYVISQLISELKKLQDHFNSAVIYLSDHGESLGEKGLFLHGLPYELAPEEQTRVPLMVWLSESYAAAKKLDRRCLADYGRRTGTFSHDNFFHSLIGLMDVRTQVYQPALDLFASCRGQ